MSSQIAIGASVLGAIVLLALTVFCGYAFLASYEFGLPNVWHLLCGTAGVAATIAAVWLIFPAFKWVMTGWQTSPNESEYLS